MMKNKIILIGLLLFLYAGNSYSYYTSGTGELPSETYYSDNMGYDPFNSSLSEISNTSALFMSWRPDPGGDHSTGGVIKENDDDVLSVENGFFILLLLALGYVVFLFRSHQIVDIRQ